MDVKEVVEHMRVILTSPGVLQTGKNWLFYSTFNHSVNSSVSHTRCQIQVVKATRAGPIKYQDLNQSCRKLVPEKELCLKK